MHELLKGPDVQEIPTREPQLALIDGQTALCHLDPQILAYQIDGVFGCDFQVRIPAAQLRDVPLARCRIAKHGLPRGTTDRDFDRRVAVEAGNPIWNAEFHDHTIAFCTRGPGLPSMPAGGVEFNLEHSPGFAVLIGH